MKARDKRNIIILAIVALILIAIPQIQYLKNKDTYFLITDDYEAYKEKMKSKVN